MAKYGLQRTREENGFVPRRAGVFLFILALSLFVRGAVAPRSSVVPRTELFMRCASCNVDNPNSAVKCAKCGAALSRRSKRRGIAQESDTPFGGPVEPANRSAVWAYRVAVLGLVPGLGLVLGPPSFVWGLWAWLRGRRNPEFTARGPAYAAILLGVLNALTNWLGLTLMIRGLMGP